MKRFMGWGTAEIISEPSGMRAFFGRACQTVALSSDIRTPLPGIRFSDLLIFSYDICLDEDNGAPGPRPHYHENYYGAFVLDPDGHNIEAVCHDAL